MSCEGCIYAPRTQVWPCADCVDESRRTVPAPKPERKPSAWEKRWIRWAKKEEKKHENL